MKDVVFSLTKEEAELLLTALVQLPYARVFNLVQKMQSQAQACLEQPSEANNAPTD